MNKEWENKHPSCLKMADNFKGLNWDKKMEHEICQCKPDHVQQGWQGKRLYRMYGIVAPNLRNALKKDRYQEEISTHMRLKSSWFF